TAGNHRPGRMPPTKSATAAIVAVARRKLPFASFLNSARRLIGRVLSPAPGNPARAKCRTLPQAARIAAPTTATALAANPLATREVASSKTLTTPTVRGTAASDNTAVPAAQRGLKGAGTGSFSFLSLANWNVTLAAPHAKTRARAVERPIEVS